MSVCRIIPTPMYKEPHSVYKWTVIDLQKQNEALLMKNLHKFFNKLDIPWVHLVWEKHYRNGKLPGTQRKGSFWWRNNLKILEKYKELTVVQVQNGQSCLLWEDNWIDGSVRAAKLKYPELFSFAKTNNIPISNALVNNLSNHLFHLPLSTMAFSQLQALRGYLEDLNVNEENDLWGYTWGSNIFLATKIYRRLIGQHQVHPVFRWLWKTICQPKHKIFFWLLLKDRLSTRNILRRKNMHLETYNCELCQLATEETLHHLFLECPFARSCWGILNLDIQPQSSFPEVILYFRDQLNSEFFLNAVILMCWTI